MSTKRKVGNLLPSPFLFFPSPMSPIRRRHSRLTHLVVPCLCSSPGSGSLLVPLFYSPTSTVWRATAAGVWPPAGIRRTGWPGNRTPRGSAGSGPAPVQGTEDTVRRRLALRADIASGRREPTFRGHSFEPNSFFKWEMNNSWHASSIPSKWLQARMTTSFGWEFSQCSTHSRVFCGAAASYGGKSRDKQESGWRDRSSPEPSGVCIWRVWSRGRRTGRWVCAQRGDRRTGFPLTAAPRCSCPKHKNETPRLNLATYIYYYFSFFSQYQKHFLWCCFNS